MYRDPRDTRAQDAPSLPRQWLICRREDRWDLQPVPRCVIWVLNTEMRNSYTQLTAEATLRELYEWGISPSGILRRGKNYFPPFCVRLTRRSIFSSLIKFIEK